MTCLHVLRSSSSSSTSTSPTPPQKVHNGSPSTSAASARERNRLKRVASKQTKQAQAMAKKAKLAPKLYKAKEGHGQPVLDFADFLLSDLTDKKWEVRHGACAALAEVTRMARVNEAWLEDVSLRLVSVLAVDKFGDFVSDAVVAPVRESAAQALGAACGRVKANGSAGVALVADLLVRLLSEEDWQRRHGGLLGVSEILLSVRERQV